MSKREELAYMRGQRQVLVSLMDEILGKLGYSDPRSAKAKLISEREAAIEALRNVCGDHGDNDWDARLHLADIIEKHLERHLNAD